MNVYLILLHIKIYFLFTSAKTYTYEEYCELNCGTYENTVCQRDNCSKTAGKTQPLDTEDRLLILDENNKFRNLSAHGEGQSVKTPTIGNMEILSYDMELEFSAQCWANAGEHDHDNCRRTPHYDHVGQNLFFNEEVGGKPTKSFLKKAIFNWFSEGNQLRDYPKLFKYQKKSSNYFQMIWPTTKFVGCGRALTKGGITVLVCNYFPIGNLEGSTLYTRKEVCSQCTECNFHYSGLCGRSMALDENIFAFEQGCQGFIHYFSRDKIICNIISFLVLFCVI